jgi:CPA1 family monovalent cation:H+ antiporter
VLGLELVVVLGVCVLACAVTASRMRVPPPLLLLACGAIAGFVPALRSVSLPPEAVLLLFLPALLYWESLTTSLREIRANLRVIVLASTGLVVATAGAVAVVAHALGLPWGPAWVLGAAVAPTDATAVGVVARMLPRRMVTVLRAESLINDGTALVIYGLAVGLTVGEEHLSIGHVTWLFLVAYAGGAVAGLLTARLAVFVRRHLHDPFQENVVSVTTPFLAFLLAEVVHASGVLAVVVCGLALSQAGPRLVRAETRQMAQAFWGLSTYILNGALFVLVGLQAQASVRDLRTMSIPDALVAVAAIAGVVIGTRLLWSFTVTFLIRAIDRRPVQRTRRVGWRARMVNVASGFRGAVSLAAALAVPNTVASGEAFPDRDVIVFITSGVIVVTLLQALILPVVVRWANLPEDGGVAEERRFAEQTATEEALAVLPDVAARLGTDQGVVDRTRHEYEKHLRLLGTDAEAVEPVRRVTDDYTALRLELIAQKRVTVVRLRDERRIDDTVLRQIQARLDIEEIRLHGGLPVE